MKFLFFGLSLIILNLYAVDGFSIPGCEKAKDFASIALTDCCSGLPRVTKFEEVETACSDCQAKPKSEALCCVIDCLLKKENVLNATGFIDNDLMKTKLLENADPAWGPLIDDALKECTRTAPQSLRTWLMISKDTAPQCDTGLNIVFNHCTYRNLFLNCPFKNDACAEIFNFGKQCKAFPMENKHKNA